MSLNKLMYDMLKSIKTSYHLEGTLSSRSYISALLAFCWLEFFDTAITE